MNRPARIYLDANVLIELFENRRSETSERLWELLRAVVDGPSDCLLSELTLAEVAVHPMRRRSIELVELYKQIITDRAGLWSIMPVERRVLERAAELRAGLPSLRLPDAIHLATAILGGSDVFVSNDQRLRAAVGRQLLPPIRSFIDFAPEGLSRLVKALA